MGFLSLFRSKSFQPEEFEQQLTQLTHAISQNQERVAALTSKRKSYCRSLSLYCTIIYLSYVALRYKTSLDNMGVLGRGRSRISVFIVGQSRRDLMVIILMPIAIAMFVYLVDFLFSFWIRSKNKTLRRLSKKHREKLDELKQVTNFSRTHQILQKFDAANSQENSVKYSTSSKDSTNDKGKELKTQAISSNIPVKRLPPTANIPNTSNSAEAMSVGTISAGEVPQNDRKNDINRQIMSSNIPHKRAAFTGPISNQLSFQDRLLDFFIGSDHNENVENRYALICVNCYTHNGLAYPGCKDPSKVTYICRYCGFINGEFSPVNEKNQSAHFGDSIPAGNTHNAIKSTDGTDSTPEETKRLIKAESISEDVSGDS